MWGKHLRYLVSTCSLELRLAKSDSEEVKRRRAGRVLTSDHRQSGEKLTLKCNSKSLQLIRESPDRRDNEENYLQKQQ